MLVPVVVHPAAVQALAAVQDLAARGFLRGVASFLLFLVILLVLIGVVVGFLVARMFNRRR